MRRIKIISLVMLLAVIAIAGWQLLAFSDRLTETAFVSEQITSDSPALIPETTAKAVMVIDDGSGAPQDFELDVQEAGTAFSLLKQAAALAGLEIQSTDYEDMGVFVEAIGAKKNGDDGRYWLYYVNGEMPMLAADKQLIAPGDRVEFRFEESSF